jgi:hypothetical protein
MSTNKELKEKDKTIDKLNRDINYLKATSSEYQAKMNNIVDAEKERLLLKKQQVDGELESKKRGIMMNESYRQRFQQYTNIVIAIVITLAIIISLILIGSTFSFIPTLVTNILIMIVLFSGMFYVYFIYKDINARDKLNYNEINLDGPTVLTPEQIKKLSEKNKKSGNLFDSLNLGTCIGQNCCSEGLKWDDENDYCIVDPAGNKTDSSSTTTPSSSTTTPSSSTTTPSSTTATSSSNIGIDAEYMDFIKNYFNKYLGSKETFDNIKQFITKKNYNDTTQYVVANEPNEYNNYSKL